MRTALLLGRLCARRGTAQIAPKLPRRFSPRSQPSTLSAFKRFSSSSGSRARPSHSTVLLAAAQGTLLGTAAFVKLSEKDNEPGDEDQTSEGRMLEVSRDEIEKKKDDTSHGFTKLRHNIVYYLDVYLWEPICTGVRFLQLVTIFVPVILAVPVIWVGTRQPDHDNERSGTLWWYGFLVQAMEWSGPAFIKVWLQPLLTFERNDAYM